MEHPLRLLTVRDIHRVQQIDEFQIGNGFRLRSRHAVRGVRDDIAARWYPCPP